MADASLRDLLDVAVDAAGGRQAHAAYFNAGTAVEWKQDGSPLTQADRESEARIRETIGRAFPDHGVLGEEEGERRTARTAGSSTRSTARARSCAGCRSTVR